ncbi:MAG: DUF6273 domain-containing protein [Candidatus Cloacimonetes bacterium]|nr:DUF6273 domain-containing protein [Candidatus Cloacimonadota bacterium]
MQSKNKSKKAKIIITIILLIISILLILLIFRKNDKASIEIDININEEAISVALDIVVPEVTDSLTVVPVAPTIEETVIEYTIGSIITFGGRDWLILDIKDNRAKIISVDIIEKKAYHEIDAPITWSSSDIRRYLNNDFYNSFGEDERTKIVETTIINENNQWYGTNAGGISQDKVFLLSVSEVVRYFGDSSQLTDRPRNARIINDEYNEKRVARYNGEASWWWLRSPGSFGFRAIRVDNNGSIDMSSNHVYDTEGGVRPVMWIAYG